MHTWYEANKIIGEVMSSIIGGTKPSQMSEQQAYNYLVEEAGYIIAEEIETKNYTLSEAIIVASKVGEVLWGAVAHPEEFNAAENRR